MTTPMPPQKPAGPVEAQAREAASSPELSHAQFPPPPAYDPLRELLVLTVAHYGELAGFIRDVLTGNRS